MKQIFIVVFISIILSIRAFSQELSLGIHAGLMPSHSEELISFGGCFEYRPAKSLFSISTDPYVFAYPGNFTQDIEFVFTGPLSIKLILGDKFRFCPTVGAFIRSNGNTGWQYGLDVDYKTPGNVIFFLKGEMYREYWMGEPPSNYPSLNNSLDGDNNLLISLGIKIMISKTVNK